MLDLSSIKPEDLRTLSPDAVAGVAARMLAQLAAQARQISEQQALAQRCDAEIKFKDAKIERITFELARLKAWKFGAKTERMNAAQRQMFEDTAAEDEADLQAQLEALQGPSTAAAARRQAQTPAAPPKARRAPAAHRAPPRTGRYHLRLRQADAARGRGCQRAPGHRAR